METPQIWDGHTHEGSVSPGAQIPAGTWPPRCQHPQSGPAQLSLLQCHSQSQFNAARPQSIPARAAGGAQLQSPHAQTHTHLQISPVICLVNSFSLEGQRVAAKHYQSNQTIPNPETNRGLPSLQTTPPQTPSHHRGVGDARPSSADTLQHHRNQKGQVTSSLSPLPVATLLTPHQWALPRASSAGVLEHRPPDRPPCTPRLGQATLGEPITQPHVCAGACALTKPRVSAQGRDTLPWIQGSATAFSILNIPRPTRNTQPYLGGSLGGCLFPPAPWSPLTAPPRWTLT